MGYEVLWSRVHHHWSMGQVSSFAVLLAVFLVFLSLGSWLATPLADKPKRPLVPAALLLAATGPAAVAPILLADRWAEAFNRLLPSIRGVHRAAPGEALALALANSIFLEAVACTLMGAAFPLLAAAAIRQGDAGRATGGLYASNTLAGVAGSVLAGFVLLPLLGVQTALLLLAVAAAIVGLAALTWMRPLPRLSITAAAVALVSLLAVGAALPADHLRSAYFASFHGADVTIEELREGTTTTAAVARRQRFSQPAYLQLLTPGVTMSDTQIGAQRYMGLMGHLPLLYSDEGTEALLICYGVGNTARALLSHPGLERLDVVDIASEVLGMSARF
jgi:spermidine synthase